MFKNDVVRQAFHFANKNHQGQVYADIYPYIIHLYDVSMVLIEFNFDDPDLLAAAWLHDIIEDTACNYHDVKNEFGEKIANIVFIITDELGKTRKERKIKTLPKLDHRTSAQTVKLADWIANVRQCHRNSHKMYQMYKRDYTEFSKLREQATDHMIPMWDELNSLLLRSAHEFRNGQDTHHTEFDTTHTRIIAAAMKDKQGNVYHLPAPARHCDVIKYMCDQKACPNMEAQGFIDEHGAFFSRERSREIVIENGQCKKTIHPNELYSNDLW